MRIGASIKIEGTQAYIVLTHGAGRSVYAVARDGQLVPKNQESLHSMRALERDLQAQHDMARRKR